MALSGFPPILRPTDNPVSILLLEFMWEVKKKNNLSTLIPDRVYKDSELNSVTEQLLTNIKDRFDRRPIN